MVKEQFLFLIKKKELVIGYYFTLTFYGHFKLPNSVLCYIRGTKSGHGVLLHKEIPSTVHDPNCFHMEGPFTSLHDLIWSTLRALYKLPNLWLYGGPLSTLPNLGHIKGPFVLPYLMPQGNPHDTLPNLNDKL